jgi:hypothetical protein
LVGDPEDDSPWVGRSTVGTEYQALDCGCSDNRLAGPSRCREDDRLVLPEFSGVAAGGAELAECLADSNSLELLEGDPHPTASRPLLKERR